MIERTPLPLCQSPDTDAQIWHLRMPSECLNFLQEWINEADDEEYVDHSKEGEICSVLLADDLYVTHETVL